MAEAAAELKVFQENPPETDQHSNTTAATQKNPQVSSKEDESKPTILIIDDDLHVRDALKIIFKNKYNVILCANGQAGIDSVNPNMFAVILDIKMEGKNGFDTFNEKFFAFGSRFLGERFWQIGDVKIIDGWLVNGTAKSIGKFAEKIRVIQSGYIYHYAFAMVIGVFLFLTFFIKI